MYDAFYPYTNGENKEIQLKLPVHELITTDQDDLNIPELYSPLQKICQTQRGFDYFREKDEGG